MRFILRMALRETRAAWKRLLFFFVCLAHRRRRDRHAAIGHRERARRDDGRGAHAHRRRRRDLHRPRRGPTRIAPTLDRAAGGRARRAGAHGRASRPRRWSRPADERKPVARMVELRGVEAGVPALRRGAAAQRRSATATRCSSSTASLVRPELLTQLDVAVGDSLIIGRTTFVIRGVLDSEPGRRSGGFSLGPRVLVDRDALVDAGLLGFGSRAQHQVMLRVDEPTRGPRSARRLTDAFKNRFINVRTFRSTENDLGEDLAARRELPEPRRPRDPRARRHRRLERHARVRRAEAEEHRDPQVRRRDHARTCSAIYMTEIARARAGREPARASRWPRGIVAALPGIRAGDGADGHAACTTA